MLKKNEKELMIISQPKWKSKYFWLAIVSLVIFVLKTYFNYEIPKVDELINLVLVALSALGIWNDSGNAESW